MATESYRKIQCPHCQEEFDAKFYTVVRGDIDIELKDLILRGDFNTLLCPNCLKTFFYEDNFIYLDPKDELLVFILPSYEKEKEKIVEKLEEEYLSIKDYLDDKLNFPPRYLFGVAELKELLEKDIDIAEESEVLIEICKEKGIGTFNISKEIARKKDLPFLIPYEKSTNRDDVIETAKNIFSENPQLKRLKNLLDLLEENDEELLIELLNEDNSFE